jgi:glycosyltransferase involved in cell wall biosynthesis
MSRPINILVIADDNLIESVVYDVHLLAETLSARGHCVTIVGSARGKQSHWRVQRSIMRRTRSDSNAVFFQFPYLRISGLNWLLGLVASYVLLRRLVRAQAFDVILMYSVLFTGIPALMAAKSQNIPTAFRTIDMLHQLFSNPLSRAMVRGLERYVYRKVDRVIALTDEYREYVQSLSKRQLNCSVLPFPVKPAFFREPGCVEDIRSQFGLDETDFVAVYMGHLYTFSALDLVVRAVPELLKTIPNFKLLVVGSGPLLTALETLRHELKIESHLILAGQQPFDLMPKFLGVSDVCLNAYTLSGSMVSLFSAKIVQYMAAAKPVISLTQPGMMSSLNSGEHGIIFVDSVPQMISDIVKLARSPDSCGQLAKKNQSYVALHYDIQVICSKLEIELRELSSLRKN